MRFILTLIIIQIHARCSPGGDGRERSKRGSNDTKSFVDKVKSFRPSRGSFRSNTPVIDLVDPNENIVSVYERQISGMSHKSYYPKEGRRLTAVSDGDKAVWRAGNGARLMYLQSFAKEDVILVGLCFRCRGIIGFEYFRKKNTWEKVDETRFSNEYRIMRGDFQAHEHQADLTNSHSAHSATGDPKTETLQDVSTLHSRDISTLTSQDDSMNAQDTDEQSRHEEKTTGIILNILRPEQVTVSEDKYGEVSYRGYFMGEFPPLFSISDGVHEIFQKRDDEECKFVYLNAKGRMALLTVDISKDGTLFQRHFQKEWRKVWREISEEMFNAEFRKMKGEIKPLRGWPRGRREKGHE